MKEQHRAKSPVVKFKIKSDSQFSSSAAHSSHACLDIEHFHHDKKFYSLDHSRDESILTAPRAAREAAGVKGEQAQGKKAGARAGTQSPPQLHVSALHLPLHGLLVRNSPTEREQTESP